MSDNNDLMDEFDGPEITEILEEGYQLLDGFIAWCEESLKLDARTSQQDCFNAEALLDFLANHHRKSVREMNEFELRWFAFSHYIRKAMAESETEDRLLSSLTRFFNYLTVEHELILTDWMRAVLDDTSYYASRRAGFHGLSSEDERAWKIGFVNWCSELDEDLDTRCLLLPRHLGDGVEWSDTGMGWREATLRFEANEQWQKDREELISQGAGYEDARRELTIAYLDWTDAPQDRLDGLSPAQVILAERLDAADEEIAQRGDDGDEEQNEFI